MSAISPAWPPSSTTLKWGLESNTGTFTSPLTKKTQMIARQGSRWHCTNELAYLNEDNARDWEGFFWLAQDGGYSFYWNRYPFNIQAKAYPNGISDSDQLTCDSDEITCDDTSTTCDAAYFFGEPVVDGNGQSGKTLQTRGWIIGATLSRGDFIAFENGSYRELHSVDSPAVADSEGRMAMSLTPPIRQSALNGVPILIDGATADPMRRCAGEFVFAASYMPADVMDVSVGYQFECFEKLDAST
jgi:hypothetical protein